MLAGVGTTWYTWLEQGRDVRASLDVLEAIARALHLTPGRAHAPDPARPRRGGAAVQAARRAGLARAPPPDREPRAEPGLRPRPPLGLPGLEPRRVRAVRRPRQRFRRPARNHLWLMFMDPARRELFSDWERSARAGGGQVPRRQRAPPRRSVVRGADPRAAPVEPGVLQGVEAPRGRRAGEGRKDIDHPVRRDAHLRARRVPPRRGARSAADPLHAAAGEDTPAKLAQLLESRARAAAAGAAG